jgi:hypothetical protein
MSGVPFCLPLSYSSIGGYLLVSFDTRFSFACAPTISRKRSLIVEHVSGVTRGTLRGMGRSHTHLKKTETAMRKSMISLLLLATAIPASAQTAQPPANPDANTPAVNSPNSSPNPGAPVAGANSFTEGQAKSRIEEKGFKNVSDLKKDDAGVWRGKADQNGKAVNVSVDFQGNVVAR